jgi:hypothetical protein
MEMFLLGMGLLYGVFVWRAWKKTALDECRDKLFDIRDDAREYFLSRGIPLDDHVYMAFRSLVNAQIKYAKRLTFPAFMSMTLAKNHHPKIMADIKREIDQRLHTDDADLNAYINKARKAAAESLIQYLGETSAFILFVVAISWPFVVIGKFRRLVTGWVEYQNRLMVAGARAFASVLLQSISALFLITPIAGYLIAIPARAGIVGRGMTGATMLEEYAYESCASA